MKTNFKFLSFALILIVLMVTVSAVSAADNTISDNNALQTTDNSITLNANANQNTLSSVENGNFQVGDTTYTNLHDAITNAQADSTIIIGSGNYTGANNYGQTINKNLIIKADDGATVIFDAENANTNILTINEQYTVTLQGLTFMNVKKTDAKGGAIVNNGKLTVNNCTFLNNNVTPVSYSNGGAAIFSPKGTLTVQDSTFINNTAPWKGSTGAVSFWGSSGLSIKNSYFENNSARFGGAIEIENLKQDSPAIDNCTFVTNNAYCGGAINLNDYCSEVNITNSKFYNNNATGPAGDPGVTNSEGGAICAGTLTNTKLNFIVTNSIFNGNSVSKSLDCSGGAISLADNVNGLILNNTFNNNSAEIGGAISSGTNKHETSNLTVADSTFINNNAISGGAISSIIGVNNTINNTSFSNNTATYGGALYSEDNSTITGSEFVNNTATANGGVMYNIGNSTISNSTFVNNTAVSMGGVIYNKANAEITNSTLNNNNAASGTAISSVEDTNLIIKDTTVVAPEGSTEPAVVNDGTSTIAPILTSNDVAIKTGDSAIVKVKIENPNNQTLKGTVTFVVEGVKQTVNIDENNIATGTLTGLSNGAHTVTITYNGDDENYTTSNTKVTVTATNYETSISNTELKTVENGTVDIYVVSEKGAVTMGNVNIFYNNKAIGTGNMNNGVATINLTGVAPGNYNVIAFYFGKDPFDSISKSLNLTIENATPIENNTTVSNVTEIVANDLNKTFNIPANFTGKLVDVNGNPIKGQYISLNLHRIGSWYYSYWATTDLNGEYQLPINLAVGQYTIESIYVGNENYTATNTSNNITVNAPSNWTKTSIIANKFSQTFGAGQNFTGKLVDVNGNPIKGQYISLNLHRIGSWYYSYWATTDLNGEFQLPINLAIGEYTIKCSYSGTSLYQPSTANTTITVTKA